MASPALDEAKSPADDAPEPTDPESAAIVAAAAPPEVKVEEKRKRGRKRKVPGEVKKDEAGAEKKVRREGGVERPLRERKTVERLIQMSPPKVPVSKVLIIEQGPGTKLKDIPNVFFKLSKRKIDDNLQVLHTILFGRKSNAHFLKRNIFQFSGFVWAGNEEKLRVRVKEKLDRCTKDRLLDLSELLDIQCPKATTKKEEIAEKLLEFLESPHATRDIVLAEIEMKGKRKRRTKGTGQSATGVASSERETKKQKSSLETEVKKRRRRSDKAKKEDDDEGGLDEKEDVDEDGSVEEEDVDEGGSINKDDLSNSGKADGDTDEESDHVKSEEEDDGNEEESMSDTKESDDEEPAEQKIIEKASPVKKYSAKSDKNPSKPVRKKAFSDAKDVPSVPAGSKRGLSKDQASRLSKANTKEKVAAVNKCSIKIPKSIPKSSPKKSTVDYGDTGPPSSSKHKKENKKKDHSNDNKVSKNSKVVKKQSVTVKVSTKEQGKGKASRNAKVGPSTEELHSVVSNILKEVDFDTATLADIVKKLGDHFNTNLVARKAEVKQIIQDVINNMPDDNDGEEEAEEDDDDGDDDDGDDDDAGDVNGGDSSNED